MPKESNEEILHTLADMNEAIGNNFEKVWAEFASVNGRFDRVDQQLTHAIERLNRIENIVLQDHARRIEALERKIGATH